MKTKYTKGFEAGVTYARIQVLEFLNAHHDLGDILTLEEVIREVEHWEIKDYETLRGLADGRLARHDRVEECKELCEDCFGTDLCVVCEGAGR
jgi:Fe2+ or Zn2+ uptake regulation protein